MSNNFKGNAALLITAIVWGSGFIAQKLGGEAMPPMSFNATRQLMASIALIPFAYFSVRSNEYFSKEKNTASLRLLESLGFTRKGSANIRGGKHNVYSLTKLQ